MPKSKSRFKKLKLSPLVIFLILLIPVIIYAALTQTNLLGRAYIPSLQDNSSGGPSGISAPIELITNSSFDANQAQLPSSWNWSSSKLARKEGQDCNTAHTGKCSFVFLNPNTKSILDQNITNLPSNLNPELTLSFYAKANRSRPTPLHALITFFDSTGRATDNFDVSGTINKGWSMFQQTFNLTKPAHHAWLQIRFLKTPGFSKVWLDDVSLAGTIALPTPTPPPSNTCSSSYQLRYNTAGCPAKQAISATYTCADKTTGTVGDGNTCVSTTTLRSQAAAACKTHSSCPSPLPTPTPTIKTCNNNIASLSYSSTSNCTSTQATQINYICSDGSSGTHGDGITCQEKSLLKSNATGFCNQICR